MSVLSEIIRIFKRTSKANEEANEIAQKPGIYVNIPEDLANRLTRLSRSDITTVAEYILMSTLDPEVAIHIYNTSSKGIKNAIDGSTAAAKIRSNDEIIK